MSSPWAPLRAVTQARIGLGRAGNALPMQAELEFRAAHAAARDAVHLALDVSALIAEVGGEPTVVASRARDRSEYLRRPDLGRLPASLPTAYGRADVAVVLADGLAPRAVNRHGPALVRALLGVLHGKYDVAPLVIATQARVALGDHIGAALGVQTVLVVIGERPGLSVADSLGVYLTHAPRPGRTDAERNCVSNIHPPDGMGYAVAARIVATLLAGACELGESGVRLKDRSERIIEG